jgi:hypothetical protein
MRERTGNGTHNVQFLNFLDDEEKTEVGLFLVCHIYGALNI